MEPNELKAHGRALVHLITHALHGTRPTRQWLEETDLAAVYRLSKRHSVSGIAYAPIKEAVAAYGEGALDRSLFVRWHNRYTKTLTRLIAYDLEREALSAFLSEKGCRYVFLKGILLSEYYPAIGMRQMSDNDILFDPRFAPDVRRYMKHAGYKTVSYGVGCHDVYAKGDLRFEMHRRLVSRKSPDRVAVRYYENVWKRLVPAGKGTERRMTDEDFYVYFLSHAHKHCTGHGYGIRFLIDTFVFLREKGSTLDRAYVRAELSRLSLSDFERTVRSLSEKLFSGKEEPLTEREEEFFLYCLSAGTFGTYETSVENRLHRLAGGGRIRFATRARYLLGRIFPPFDYYLGKHPVLARLILPIPFLWIARLLRGAGRGRDVREELYHLRNAK